MDEFPQARANAEETDREVAKLGFGTGGVPWLLLLFYIGFLVFFTWYTVEYQVPAVQEEVPAPAEPAEASG